MGAGSNRLNDSFDISPYRLATTEVSYNSSSNPVQSRELYGRISLKIKITCHILFMHQMINSKTCIHLTKLVSNFDQHMNRTNEAIFTYNLMSFDFDHLNDFFVVQTNI